MIMITIIIIIMIMQLLISDRLDCQLVGLWAGRKLDFVLFKIVA